MNSTNPLERAAMLIVLEASRTSTAPTRRVRRKLIAALEAALRERGFDIDAGLAFMAARRKQDWQEHIARRDAPSALTQHIVK